MSPSTSNAVAQDSAEVNVNRNPLFDRLAELDNIIDCLELAMEDNLATMEEYVEAYHQWEMCMEAIAATDFQVN